MKLVCFSAPMVAGLLLASPVLFPAPEAWAVAGPGGFEFSTPEGWLNLSPGVDEAARRTVPPTLLALVDNGQFAFFASAPRPWDGGFVENVNAIVRTGARPPKASLGMLDEVSNGVRDQVSSQGMSYKMVAKSLVQIEGVTVGRLVAEMAMPSGIVTKTVQYMVPGQQSLATLTFSTTPERFALFESTFDAAARRTRGMSEPPDRTIWKGWYLSAILGAIGGGIVFLWRRNGRKKRPG
jgi:hypothetical protein